MPSCPTFCLLPLCQVLHFLKSFVTEMLLKTFISCTKAFVSTSLCQQNVFSDSRLNVNGSPLDSPSRLLLQVFRRKLCTAWANLYMLRFKMFHLGYFLGMQETNSRECHVPLLWKPPRSGEHSGVPYSIRDGALCLCSPFVLRSHRCQCCSAGCESCWLSRQFTCGRLYTRPWSAHLRGDKTG